LFGFPVAFVRREERMSANGTNSEETKRTDNKDYSLVLNE
jgi:hypothetical protein